MKIKNDNEELDNLVDEFLNVVKHNYNERYYFLRLNQSKTKSIHFLLRKRRSSLSKTKKKLFDGIESISKLV